MTEIDIDEDYAAIQQKALRVSKDLIFQKGLYGHIDLADGLGEAAEQLIRNARIGTVDCYCTTCKRETSFIIQAQPIASRGGGLRHGNALSNPPRIFGLVAVCQRDMTAYHYAFKVWNKRLIKIGQFPSMADIAFGELKQIDKGLDPVDRTELGKALGLFSHDATLGAFVYLRRVFERLIARTHTRQSDRGNPVDGFDTMRMEDKIAFLKDELPEKVVRNRSVFSVLSLGIHELSDEKCLVIFPVMKAIIFQMLEQEEHKRKQKIAEEETESAFQALLSSGLAEKDDKSK